MAIAKRPPKQSADSERAAAAFISKAGKATAPDAGKTPVLFRFMNDFLERIDAAAKKHELPRLAWVRTVIVKALEAEGL
jgi:hypothetical protein